VIKALEFEVKDLRFNKISYIQCYIPY